MCSSEEARGGHGGGWNETLSIDRLSHYREKVNHFYRLSLWTFFMYVIQHCFICRPSDSAVSEDAGIEARTVATFALTARRSNHSARSHPQNLPMRKQGIYLISPSFMPLLHRFHPGNLILKLRAKDPLVFHCQISPWTLLAAGGGEGGAGLQFALKFLKDYHHLGNFNDSHTAHEMKGREKN